MFVWEFGSLGVCLFACLAVLGFGSLGAMQYGCLGV